MVNCVSYMVRMGIRRNYLCQLDIRTQLYMLRIDSSYLLVQGFLGFLSYLCFLGHWILFRLQSEYLKIAGFKYHIRIRKSFPRGMGLGQ